MEGEDWIGGGGIDEWSMSEGAVGGAGWKGGERRKGREWVSEGGEEGVLNWRWKERELG